MYHNGVGWIQETGVGPVMKFQIRLRSEQPTLIENTEQINAVEATFAEAVMQRTRVMVGRTSFMGEGKPSREVWWAVDQWHFGREKWECIVDGKSRLKKGARPL